MNVNVMNMYIFSAPVVELPTSGFTKCRAGSAQALNTVPAATAPAQEIWRC